MAGWNGRKSRIAIAMFLFSIMLVSVPDSAFAYSGGKTGSSSNGCGGGGCHSSSSTVSPTLTGLPSSGYSAGSTYSLSIGGSGGPSGSKGGFNLDSNSGTFTNAGSNAKLQSGEVTHSNSNSRSWTVDWTAPSTGSGTAIFYLAVNFVDGNGGASGDAWGTDSWSISEATSATNTTNSTIGPSQPGSDRGSVFSNSILDLDSGSPVLVMSNGSLVTFSAVTSNGSTSSVADYTEDEVISKAGQCAILENRTLRCRGMNNYGQLGLGSTTLMNGTVEFGNNIPVAVSNGNTHTCAILDDASLKCWGRNNHGQLGDGSNTNRNSPVDVDLGVNRTAVSVSAGNDFTCALLNTGDVKCWGYNGFGTLADGTTSDSNTPVTANHSTGMRAVSLATPGYSVCSIFENGSVYCWGRTYTVSSENGAVTNGSENIPFSAGRTANSIDGTYWHTCAILDNGSMNCWGLNTHGQWGDGSCSSSISTSGCTGEDGNVPVHVSIGGPVLAIATGEESTCAIVQNYSLACWGGQSGELDGTSDDLLVPHWMNFDDGADLAFSDQDHDGDGIWNDLDTHIAGDEDGDGVSVPSDPYPSNPARWLDCEEGQWGRLACQDSPAGHFSVHGSLYYNECIPGSYQPEAGQSACHLASAGHYVTSSAAEAQTQCGAGTYQADIGQITCADSSPGNQTNQLYGDAPDFSGNSYPRVNLSDRSATYIGELNAGQNPADHGDLFAIDVPRDSGFSLSLTSPGGANFDLSVYNSTISLLGSSTSNTSAGLDTFSTNGTGFSGDSIAFIHVNRTWGNGSYSMSLWLFSTDDGSLVGNSTFQIAVEIGVRQYECYPGTYQPGTRQSSCLGASPGNYVPSSGASSQTQCEPGTYQPMYGQTSCVQASLGNYVPSSGASTQTPASMGYYVPSNGSSSQTACPAGTYQNSTGQASCINADAGYYVPSNASNSQTPCAPGTYQPSSGSTSCIDADAGYFVYYYNSTSQTPCAPGTYQPSTGQSTCLNASPGNYVPSNASTTQTPCSAGTYQPLPGQDKCDGASPGYYVDSEGSSSQTPCSPGTYQPYGSQTTCLDSPAGHYVDYSAATSPTPCPAGTYNPSEGSSDSSECLGADPGHSVPSNGSTFQIPCTVGHYQPISGQASCLEADPGNYVGSEGSIAQYECDTGSYQPSTGSATCFEAEAGHYVDGLGQSSQTPCPEGTYNPSTGANSSAECSAADPGHYVANPGSDSQTPCSEGTYQPNSGRSSCVDADPGHFVSTDGSSDQSQCPAGTYNPQTGSTSPYDCLDADPGSYVQSPASSGQEKCSPGSFQPDPGQTSCNPSQPGFYAPSEGQDQQTPAPLDFYVSEASSTTLEQCPESHITLQEGAESADECYSDLDGDRVHDDIDEDDDGDGIDDAYDHCPQGLLGWTSTSENDYDVDGCNDSEEDEDDDNDGFPDSEDALPLDFGEWVDSDMDGIGDNSDTDDDNDGLSDVDEEAAGSNRLDTDTDDDNFEDGVDAFPVDPTEWSDTDGDGYGDNGDAFPEDPDRHLEPDSMAKYAFLGAALVIISLIGLGGWMVMRRRSVSEPVKESIQTEEASLVDIRQTVIEEPMQFESSSDANESEAIETSLPEAIDESVEDEQVPTFEESRIEPEASKIAAPDDARMNEHGQLVWTELSGSVYCQNPDGSIMVFDPMSGTWKGVDQ